MKVGKHNPCLDRDLYGIRRNIFPIFTDLKSTVKSLKISVPNYPGGRPRAVGVSGWLFGVRSGWSKYRTAGPPGLYMCVQGRGTSGDGR